MIRIVQFCFFYYNVVWNVEAFSGTTRINPSGMSSFEVVGKGRIASLFLRFDESISVDSRNQSLAGMLSEAGCPIVVATPSHAWPNIYQQCAPDRRSDLIWMGNGLPEEEWDVSTWVVPHFGVLQINGPIVTAATSPPTYIYGKHANFVQETLRSHGVSKIQIVDTIHSLRRRAVHKLLWASCLWLLCHEQSSLPLTVSRVHVEKSALLRELVQELWPAVLEVAAATDEEFLSSESTDIESVLQYMEQYSQSMPDAIPSRALALAELHDRNGKFYRPGKQPCHERLLRKQLLLEQTGASLCSNDDSLVELVVKQKKDVPF